MKTKLSSILLALALVQPAITQAQDDGVPKALSENFRVEHYVEPAFPASLTNKGIVEGYAQIQLLVAADGTLLETFVSAYSREEFAESIESAVNGWRFSSAGSPGALPERMNIRFDFRREGLLVIQGDPQETVNHFLGWRDDREVAICKLRDLDATPEIMNLVIPTYPEALKKQQVEGFATVSFYIDEQGLVRVASVSDSSRPEFATAAVEAVKQWKFTPPLRKGGATRVLAMQDFTFGPPGPATNGRVTR